MMHSLENLFIRSKASAISFLKGAETAPARESLRRTVPYLVIVMLIGEFMVDLYTPLGFSDWMSYVIPIILTSWLSKRWTIAVTSVVTVLIVVGLILSPRPLSALPLRSMVNRAIGLCIFWLAALFIHLRRRALEHLQSAHAELRSQSKKLVEMERLRTEFVADTSHELRAPLAIIQSHLDLALRKQSRQLTDPYRALRDIRIEVKQMSDIIADLILLTKSTTTAYHALNRASFPLDELILNVVKKHIPYAKNRGIVLIPRLTPVSYNGDHEKLVKLFSNLLENAIRYGKMHGSVIIALTRNDKHIVITLTDDGIGIPEADIPHIFERFYRVEKTRARSMGGVGLGLAISKWITEAHGGSIRATSTLGEGSVFTVTLPA